MSVSRWIIPTGGVVLLLVVAGTGHVPAAPDTSACQARVIASEGTPPPGAPQLDPRALCGALDRAVKEADCMGGAMPMGDRVNARTLCLDVQRAGCGNQGRDCSRIPDDVTYYTRP